MSEIDTAVPAVEVSPVAATEATQAPESTAEQAATPPEGGSPEAPTERTFTQKELDDIVQKRLAKESRRIERVAQAEARAQHAERQLAELKAPPPSANTSTGEPLPAQFQDYETYIAALTDWKVEQKLSGIRKESAEYRQQKELEQTAAKIMPKIEKGREKYDDFDDVVMDFVKTLPQPAHDAIIESDVPSDLLYYLGQNPAERDRIFRLSNVGQVKAISALEAKLSATPSPTKAPPPIVPNPGKSPVKKSYADMDYDEFVAARRKEIAARR